MLAVKGLLDSLSKENIIKNHENRNDDYDPEDVLRFLCDKTISKHKKVRCSDGIEREISFDDWEVKN